jgi:hypothetical protein
MLSFDLSDQSSKNVLAVLQSTNLKIRSSLFYYFNQVRKGQKDHIKRRLLYFDFNFLEYKTSFQKNYLSTPSIPEHTDRNSLGFPF